jgi:transcriptional regulator with XRE-family HTH domain
MRATVSNRSAEQSTKAIKVAMLHAELQGRDIAERLKVSPQMVSQVINGRKRSRRVEGCIARLTKTPRSVLWPR